MLFGDGGRMMGVHLLVLSDIMVVVGFGFFVGPWAWSLKLCFRWSEPFDLRHENGFAGCFFALSMGLTLGCLMVDRVDRFQDHFYWSRCMLIL